MFLGLSQNNSSLYLGKDEHPPSQAIVPIWLINTRKSNQTDQVTTNLFEINPLPSLIGSMYIINQSMSSLDTSYTVVINENFLHKNVNEHIPNKSTHLANNFCIISGTVSSSTRPCLKQIKL